MSERVGWDEVESAAGLAFDIRVAKPEMVWAERTWRALAEAGFSDYVDDCGRHVVLLRLLALAGIYRDFCAVAWEERWGRDYSYWAEPLDLSDFALGQLYAQSHANEPLGGEEVSDALTILVEDQRASVVSALRRVFGDTNGLYESLWRSGQGNDVEDDDEVDEDGDANGGSELIIPGLIEGSDPWHPLTAHRHAAYEWVSEGCPSCG